MTSSPSSGWSTSGISGAVIDVEGDDAAPPGHDRRAATVLAFALSLAFGSATIGRDGPEATAPVDPPRMLIVSPGTSDVVLFAFPDRLANEPLPNLPYVTVSVRGTEGLAVSTGDVFAPDNNKWIGAGAPATRVQGWLITWTEAGTEYSLSSESRDLSDLLRVAGSLR